MTKIYALMDPRTMRLRYIGKTTQSEKRRLCEHISEARRGAGGRKNIWIRTLLLLGLRPVIEVLDTVEGGGDREEIACIGLALSLGCSLVNVQAGGTSNESARLHWEVVHAKLNARVPQKRRGTVARLYKAAK